MVSDQTQRWACYCFLCLSEYGDLPQRNTLCCHSKSFHHRSCYCTETLLSIKINCEVDGDWENKSRSLPAKRPQPLYPTNAFKFRENFHLLWLTSNSHRKNKTIDFRKSCCHFTNFISSHWHFESFFSTICSWSCGQAAWPSLILTSQCHLFILEANKICLILSYS